MFVALQILRLVVVVALLCFAASVATPKGRLPLALRGVLKVMRRDGVVSAQTEESRPVAVSAAKRTLAFVCVIVAVMLVCL